LLTRERESGTNKRLFPTKTRRGRHMKTLKRVLGGLGLIILALAVTAGGLVG
jgi:hypothetical protein